MWDDGGGGHLIGISASTLYICRFYIGERNLPKVCPFSLKKSRKVFRTRAAGHLSDDPILNACVEKLERRKQSGEILVVAVCCQDAEKR